MTIAAAAEFTVAVACGESSNYLAPRPTSTAAKGAPGGGGGGGGGGTLPPVTTTPVPAPSGGTQIPPSPQIDGAAWFFAEFGGVAGPSTANIDFDAMQNLPRGGIGVGTSRTAGEFVYNVSKKTSLTITGITFLGANPGDFSIAPADLAAAATTVLAPNKGTVEVLHVSFTPTGEGLRTATLRVTSAAGIADILLSGTGLLQRPMIADIAPLSFIATSAPANLTIANVGGQTLSLDSISIEGANATAFTFFVANHGLSNCFDGILLAPKSDCLLAVGLAPGATAPATAMLVIRTNDPITPRLSVPLTFTP